MVVGDGDLVDTGVDHAQQIVAAERDRGLPVDYVTVPDEGHGFMKLHNRIKIYGAMAEFLDRYL